MHAASNRGGIIHAAFVFLIPKPRASAFLRALGWLALAAPLAASLLPLPAAAQDTAPSVAGVSITSRPSMRTATEFWPYQRDRHIDVALTFSRAVTVTGAPRLALTIGSRTRHAAFRSVSGAVVNFRYTVMGGDRDSDGIAIAADALTLNGGAIEAGGASAALGLGSHALGNQANHRVDGDGPTFDGVAQPAYAFTRDVRGSFTLPAATSADPFTTYALAATPALPGGLSFDPATRTLSGAPEVGMAKTALHARCRRPGHRQRARGLAAVHGHGRRGHAGGEQGLHRLLPGQRRELRDRGEHRRRGHLQLLGDGDRHAAARALPSAPPRGRRPTGRIAARP